MSLRAERHYSWVEYAQRMVENPRTTRICMGNLPRLFDKVADAGRIIGQVLGYSNIGSLCYGLNAFTSDGCCGSAF